jgi:hypothetical protein
MKAGNCAMMSINNKMDIDSLADLMDDMEELQE